MIKFCEFGILIGDKDCKDKGIGTSVTHAASIRARDIWADEILLSMASLDVAMTRICDKVGFGEYDKTSNDKNVSHGKMGFRRYY